jgi:hypothetical protein
LIITFMFEPAKLQMNWASASGRIRRRADASGRSGVRVPLAATRLSIARIHTCGECRQASPGVRFAG